MNILDRLPRPASDAQLALELLPPARALPPPRGDRIPPAITPHGAGEIAMRAVLARAEADDPGFANRARAFVLDFLANGRQATGEQITDAAKESGLRPPDDRAFGPVIQSLARRGEILRCGFAIRTKGHGTPGASIWRLA